MGPLKDSEVWKTSQMATLQDQSKGAVLFVQVGLRGLGLRDWGLGRLPAQG